MAKLSKRKELYKEKVDPTKFYPVDDAFSLVKELATAKFSADCLNLCYHGYV